MKTITSIILSSIILLQGCGGGGGGSVPETVTENTDTTLTITSSAEDYTVVGKQYSISWRSQSKSNCNSSGSWSGEKTASGTTVVTPSTDGTLTYTISCGSNSASVSVKVLPEYTLIPDSRFEQALITLTIDDTIDGRVKTEKILAVKDLWIISTPDDYKHPAFFANLGTMFGSYKILPVTNFFSDIRTPFTGGGKIINLIGIENFKNLEVLSISGQNFTTINLDSLTKLKWLALNKIPLSRVDLKPQSGLVYFHVSETPLTTVDVTPLINLVQFEIHNDDTRTLPYTTDNGVVVTGMASIDISNQPDLIRFYCNNNRISSLNLYNNKKLQELWAMKNIFTLLDLSGMSTLNYIMLSGSAELTELNIKGVAGGGVPYRLYTEQSPKLTQIKVTSTAAIQNRINTITANTPVGQTPALGLYWDSWTTLVNAP